MIVYAVAIYRTDSYPSDDTIVRSHIFASEKIALLSSIELNRLAETNPNNTERYRVVEMTVR